jgi:GDP-4-dehydro-6-deoxy-D-mannose reductase
MNDPERIRTVLITGISGSGGSYLAEWIVRNQPQVEVHGLSRWHSTTVQNLSGVGDRVKVHEADLTDFPSVLNVLTAVKPDAIFHLAAHANVRTSFITPNSVLSNNILGTSHLFEAYRTAGLTCPIQLCSTSEVYGQVPKELVPIKEDAPLNPVSPYAVSKVAQDLLGFAYFKSYRMPIIRTRMFTYVNPRRTDLFATSFARQVAWIEKGLASEVVHGNLDSIRTLIDIRDAMEAYWVAILRGEPGEVYNIGGTSTMSVGDVLNRLVGMATRPIPTRVDPNLLRPADVTLQIPSTEKFSRTTGWKPRYSADDSLADLLAYWRHQASIEVARQAT